MGVLPNFRSMRTQMMLVPFEACTTTVSGDTFCASGIATVCKRPTASPTLVPAPVPTKVPTPDPTAAPTKVPTPFPTAKPFAAPTKVPTLVPTAEPTAAPTKVPTSVPTAEPTKAATTAPTPVPGLKVKIIDPDLVCYNGVLKVKVKEQGTNEPVDGQPVTVTFSGPLAPLQLTTKTRHTGVAKFTFQANPSDAGDSPFEACTTNGAGRTFCASGIATVCDSPTAAPTLRQVAEPTASPTEGKASCEIVMQNEFVHSEEGYHFKKDIFRGTHQPYYAIGFWDAIRGKDGTGGIKLKLGAKDDHHISGMSGGWCKTFYLDTPQEVKVSFAYKLIVSNACKHDVTGQLLFSLDGSLVGLHGNDYIDQIYGSGQTPYGDLVELNLGTLSAGAHNVCFGGYMNKKTLLDEYTHISFDSISVEAC